VWWWMILAVLAAEDFEGRRYYFGDIHAHTGASGDGGSADLGTCERLLDGSPATCGAVADLGALAFKVRLDFLATVDHVTSEAGTTTQAAFEQVYSLVNDLNSPETGFITIPGAEIFVELPGGIELGHRSLLMFGRPDSLDGIAMSDLQPSGSTSNQVPNCGALSTFMQRLEERFGPVLLIPHHPGVDKPMATDWNCHDPRWAPVVEAYSEHGSSLDASSDFDPPWGGFEPSGTVLTALDPAVYGHRLGLVGGTDNHDTHPGDVCRKDTVLDEHPYSGGLTAVVLDASVPFGRLSLYGAISARSTYTTTGPKLPMRMSIVGSDGATLATMGQVLTVGPGADLTVEVAVPVEHAPVVDSVILISDTTEFVMDPSGPGRWRIRIPSDSRPDYVLADVRVDGDGWFTEGCDDGGTSATEHLWSSPIWFEVATSPDDDADGFSVSDGDCDDSNPFIYPGAPEACATPNADYDCDGWQSDEDPACIDDTAAMKDTGRAHGTPTAAVGPTTAPPKSGCATIGDLTPEPAPWAMLSWGIAGLVGLGYRRRDRQ